MRTVLCALLLLTASARAAPPSEADLFDQGEAAYRRGDYATAIATWQPLYQRTAEPELLFAIAQAHRLSGDCPDALEQYQRFLATPSGSPHRPLAAELVGELTARCDPAPAPRVVAQSGSSLRLDGVVAGSLGAATLVAGLVVGRRAATLGDAVTRDCAAGCAWPAERSRDADGRRDATVGRVLDGVGVAAIVVGVGLYAWGAWESPPVTVRGTAGGASLSWSGSW